MNKRAMGSEMEKRARRYLEKQGVWILVTNYSCRKGEVDLIGKLEDTLIFFEVKARSTDQSGTAAEAVDERKQKKICLVADYYRMQHLNLAQLQVRFDVLAFDGEETTWIKDAFPYQGKGF
ncbi:MAG: YraN family protein [Lachnospiraceae bacterium]|nr:YraN family protein [Lachnospiraceae bacterium]